MTQIQAQVPRWIDELDVCHAEMNVSERDDPSHYEQWLEKGLDRMGEELDRLAWHAVWRWLDVTEAVLRDGKYPIACVRLFEEHGAQPSPRLAQLEKHRTPWRERFDPKGLVVYPRCIMLDANGHDDTVVDPYLDAFESWTMLWSRPFEELVQIRLGQVFEVSPGGDVTLNNLDELRQKVLGPGRLAFEARCLARTVPSTVSTTAVVKPRL